MRSLKVSRNRMLKNAREALCYCLAECLDFRLGCALECKIRRHFKIPPHGESYSMENSEDKIVAIALKERSAENLLKIVL